MTKTKAKRNNANKRHVFHNVRDPICTGSDGTNPTPVQFSTDGSGNATFACPIVPLGLRGLSTNNAAAGAQTAFTCPVVSSAPCPWLFNTAKSFERYRMLRCTLIFVGNVGSTATGRVAMSSSTDYMDTSQPTSVGLSSGGRVFDLSTAAGKELRMQCDVDTSWKKVSQYTFALQGVAQTSSSAVCVPVNTVNDLMCTSIDVALVGCTPAGTISASAILGSLFLEYDVEFSEPVAYGANV